MQKLAIIQSLWIGDRLSTMERLCIASFLYHGHSFHLYTYSHVENLPEGTIIKDANEILPSKLVFTCQHGSYAAFADIFRYKLLLEKGSYWVDTDVICLQPFDDDIDYIFASERLEHSTSDSSIHITNCVIKSPPSSTIMKYCYEKSLQKDPNTIEWGEIGPKLIQKAVNKFHMNSNVANPEKFCPIDYWNWNQLTDPIIDKHIPSDSKAIHLWNEMWRKNNIDKNSYFNEESIYEKLKKKYLEVNHLHEPDFKINNDLVSIIIPCYNQAQYLEEAVESVIGQTYPNIEIIIVNDGSLDNIQEVALKLQKKHPKKIYILKQKNSGLHAARNSGIRQASGLYIIPLDADDKLDNQTITKCKKTMLKYDADIVYFGYTSFGVKIGTNKWKPFHESFPLYHTPCSATALF